MQAFAQWLATTPVSREIQGVLWVIPALQAVHILAIAAILSSILMIDLRLLGVAGRSQTMHETGHRFLPWIWASLIVLAATGLTLVVGEPKRSLLNPAFQLKMLLLACAVVATLAFHMSLRRNLAFWEGHRSKVIGGVVVLTFLLWCAIAVAGRWIAYLQPY